MLFFVGEDYGVCCCCVYCGVGVCLDVEFVVMVVGVVWGEVVVDWFGEWLGEV